MKFRLFCFAVIALIVAGCAGNQAADLEEDIVAVESGKRVLQVKASFQETRATLVEMGNTLIKDIRFKWDTTDEIQFCFVQDDKNIQNVADVTGVSADGRTAYFTVTVPSEIDVAHPYTLYAYRSSNQFRHNTTIAVLPDLQYEYMATLEEQAALFSIWSKKEITPDMTSVSLSFNHLGSMMTLNLKNVGADPINDLHSLAFLTNPTNNWLINRHYGNGGAWFDVSTGNYVVGHEKFSSALTFMTPSPTIAPGSVATYYLWFVPKPDVQLPIENLFLVSMQSPGDALSITGLTNATRTITKPLETGKNYVFFATIERDPVASPPRPYLLKFTNSSYIPSVP